jgi:3-methylfumaryl-CoA hydratase
MSVTVAEQVDALQQLIGSAAWPEQQVEVHEADILRYVEATNSAPPDRDTDGVLLAPPMFLPPFAVGGTIGEDGRRARPGETVVVVPGLDRRLMAGCEIAFSAPIRAGETIVASATFAEIYVKEGRSGPMVLVVTEIRYRNRDGEDRRIERWTIIHR